MDAKPLPDRIRKLEGAGFHNLMDNAGYGRRRKFAWLPLVGSVLGGVVLGYILTAWMVSP